MAFRPGGPGHAPQPPRPEGRGGILRLMPTAIEGATTPRHRESGTVCAYSECRAEWQGRFPQTGISSLPLVGRRATSSAAKMSRWGCRAWRRKAELCACGKLPTPTRNPSPHSLVGRGIFRMGRDALCPRIKARHGGYPTSPPCTETWRSSVILANPAATAGTTPRHRPLAR
jgi:hypothetical protein